MGLLSTGSRTVPSGGREAANVLPSFALRPESEGEADVVVAVNGGQVPVLAPSCPLGSCCKHGWGGGRHPRGGCPCRWLRRAWPAPRWAWLGCQCPRGMVGPCAQAWERRCRHGGARGWGKSGMGGWRERVWYMVAEDPTPLCGGWYSTTLLLNLLPQPPFLLPWWSRFLKDANCMVGRDKGSGTDRR